MNRGVALMNQYCYAEAVRTFEKAIELAPGLTDARINLAIARFNRSLNTERDMERALELLDGVLVKEPENLRALYFKGIVLQQLGKAKEAIPCFEKVVKARPEDGAAWYLLGLCRMRAGQEAEQDFLNAVKHRPYLYSAYYKLFQIALAKKEKKRAQEYIKRFQELRACPLGEAIELPQYNQMGDLALVAPVPARPAKELSPAAWTFDAPAALWTPKPPPRAAAAPIPLPAVAAGEFNGDGRPDLALVPQSGPEKGRVLALLSAEGGGWSLAPKGTGLEGIDRVRAVAVGDVDNDGLDDLFLARTGTNLLLRGLGGGRFADVTGRAGVGGDASTSVAALFLDADHDADLDIFVCNAAGPAGGPPVCRLWLNRANGSFTNVASGPLAERGAPTAGVLAADLDGDRDMDLVLLRSGRPAEVFLNELAGRFKARGEVAGALGGRGGVLQDFNGDGQPDLLVLGGEPARVKLFFGDGRGGFEPAAGFDNPAAAAAAAGPLLGLRAVDADLDGDLDAALLVPGALRLLLNDGAGRFVFRSKQWEAPRGSDWTPVQTWSLASDPTPDLLLFGSRSGLALCRGRLDPPGSGLWVQPTGMRGRDKRTRSPASGYGARLTLRSGLLEQTRVYQGVAGGPNQSHLPVLFGLGGAPQADYLHILWPDGVAQAEIELAAGQAHRISELQRKISSCPVLFAWDGERFRFLTDFAGVSGLGYLSAPGEYAQPQPEEWIKIEPQELKPKDGFYEIRVTEPMEESAYVDRLELLAIDHPAGWRIYPDERLAVSGPPPTHRLLAVPRPLFPRKATGPAGEDCTANVLRRDRIYAYRPPIDRRFYGFCRPHTIELDFGPEAARLDDGAPVFLFINGFIEYPYSQTVYASSQAGVGWEPLRVEGRREDGRWVVLVPDGGAPGGMGRTMTIELTGKLRGATGRLRLTTNLEIYYDQIFLGRDAGLGAARIRRLPVASAELRYLGFPIEFSPDGRLPWIYDYDIVEATAPFHVLRGRYTRYGPVAELLQRFDDCYVLVAPGDEIAVRFDASALPPPGPGWERSFVLVSHAWCKDMDLYTGEPRDLAPLPFAGMSRYPYPPEERYPEDAAHQAYQRRYNTRWVE